MSRNNRVIFTDNKQSSKGIMSVILGTISLISLIYCFSVSYHTEGAVSERFGPALIVTLVFAIVGMVLGVAGRREIDKFKLIPTIGIITNGVAVVVLGFLMWIGLR